MHLHNFLSKPSKHLTSICIQSEAKFLNPDETEHLSSVQLKQWIKKKKVEARIVTSDLQNQRWKRTGNEWKKKPQSNKQQNKPKTKSKQANKQTNPPPQ